MLLGKYPLSIVAGLSQNHMIGCDNKLPWHLPADLKHFRALTLGKPVLMGRKTHESIGRPLPKRQNIILTRNPDFKAEGCDVIHALDELPNLLPDPTEIMLIGGEQLYRLLLPQADTLHLTLVNTTVEGDAFFPEWNADEWQETAREHHTADEENEFDYDFVSLVRSPQSMQN